jgi:uncharacterized protein
VTGPDNVEIVRRLFDQFASNRIDEMRAAFADDFEWTYHGPEEVPWAGTYRGPGALDRFLAIVRGVIELDRFAAREFIGCGDRVVVLGTSGARVLASGARYDTHWVNVFTLRDGRVTRLIDLYETASIVEALRAAPSQR